MIPDEFITKLLDGLFSLLSYLPATWGWDRIIYTVIYSVMGVLLIMILREYRW